MIPKSTSPCPKRAATTLAIVLLSTGWLACGDGEGAGTKAENFDPPNIVVVLVDTLRADHTSVYGYARNTTPNLARIADVGLLARQHFSNAPWTKPSVGSILTGAHPSAHGSRTGQFEQVQKYKELVAAGKPPMIEILAERLETLPEKLRDAGYRTAAFLSNYHLDEKFGYAQGYDDYLFVQDREAIDRTIELLASAERPVFAWCHLMTVHEYAYPDDFALFSSETATPIDPKALQRWRVAKYATIEQAVDAYDNSIRYADSLVGELFDFIQAEAPNTILVVTSDHGEEFYEHGGFEHVNTLYNEMLKIPLVVYGPGVPTGSVEGLSDTTDILPSLLRAAGVIAPAGLAGRPLWASGKVGAGKAEVFAEQHHRGPATRFTVLRADGKLILSIPKARGAEKSELYADGLRIEGEPADPSREGVLFRELRARIEDHRRQNQAWFDRNVGSSRYEHLDENDLRALEALGYIEPEADAPTSH